MKNLKAYIAEAIGTFVLVFFAVGTAITTNETLPTALAFGFVIFAMAYSIGEISGCHINPAVSLGCFLTKRMSLKDFVAYVIAQIIGGLLGAVVLFAVCKCAGCEVDFFKGAGSNFILGGYSAELTAGKIIGALLVEIILTAVFVYVILNVTDGKNSAGKFAGVIIGITLTLVHLVGIGFTGTSVNPARSIATAFGNLFFGKDAKALSQIWIFIIGPMGGAALAVVLYNLLNVKKEAKKAPAKAEANPEADKAE